MAAVGLTAAEKKRQYAAELQAQIKQKEEQKKREHYEIFGNPRAAPAAAAGGKQNGAFPAARQPAAEPSGRGLGGLTEGLPTSDPWPAEQLTHLSRPQQPYSSDPSRQNGYGEAALQPHNLHMAPAMWQLPAAPQAPMAFQQQAPLGLGYNPMNMGYNAYQQPVQPFSMAPDPWRNASFMYGQPAAAPFPNMQGVGGGLGQLPGALQQAPYMPHVPDTAVQLVQQPLPRYEPSQAAPNTWESPPQHHPAGAGHLQHAQPPAAPNSRVDPKKAAYKAELEAQIREREERKARERMRERDENLQFESTMPWVPQRRGRALVPGEKETGSKDGSVVEAWNRAKETTALERKQSNAGRRRHASVSVELVAPQEQRAGFAAQEVQMSGQASLPTRTSRQESVNPSPQPIVESAAGYPGSRPGMEQNAGAVELEKFRSAIAQEAAAIRNQVDRQHQEMEALREHAKRMEQDAQASRQELQKIQEQLKETPVPLPPKPLHVIFTEDAALSDESFNRPNDSDTRGFALELPPPAAVIRRSAAMHGAEPRQPPTRTEHATIPRSLLTDRIMDAPRFNLQASVDPLERSMIAESRLIFPNSQDSQAAALETDLSARRWQQTKTIEPFTSNTSRHGTYAAPSHYVRESTSAPGILVETTQQDPQASGKQPGRRTSLSAQARNLGTPQVEQLLVRNEEKLAALQNLQASGDIEALDAFLYNFASSQPPPLSSAAPARAAHLPRPLSERPMRTRDPPQPLIQSHRGSGTMLPSTSQLHPHTSPAPANGCLSMPPPPPPGLLLSPPRPSHPSTSLDPLSPGSRPLRSYNGSLQNSGGLSGTLEFEGLTLDSMDLSAGPKPTHARPGVHGQQASLSSMVDALDAEMRRLGLQPPGPPAAGGNAGRAAAVASGGSLMHFAGASVLQGTLPAETTWVTADAGAG